MLKDYNSIKTHFDIVRGTNSTVTRGFYYKNIIIIISLRDTMLLSPPGSSLSKIGDLYDLPKIDLDSSYKNNMDVLMEENYELFKTYAMRDSLICLLHCLSLEDFNYKLLGINTIVNPFGLEKI